MIVKFGQYNLNDVGVFRKSNEIIANGVEVTVTLDLNSVSSMYANFNTSSNRYTIDVKILDKQAKLINVPFIKEFFEVGNNSFEIVALMNNGDICASQTCMYKIAESLDNGNDITEETNYPILIELINQVSAVVENGGNSSGGGHTHTNKSVLDNITSTKVREWDNKSNFDSDYNSLSNKPIIPTVDVNKSYVDQELSKKANENHLHNEYLTDLPTHSHDYNDLTNKPSIPTVDVTKSYVDSELIKKSNLTHIHDEYLTELPNHNHSYNDLSDKPTLLKGDKGDKGDNGNDGYTPIKGVDYFDGVDGTDGRDGVDYTETLVNITYSGNTLNLTTDKFQIATLTNNTVINLPSVNSFTQIHLFFDADSDLTVTLPSCKWQTEPKILGGNSYEIIFTYTNKWLGGVVEYV